MIDKLIEKIEHMENPTVVGLDPTLDMMPEFLKASKFEVYGKTPKAVADMFLDFNKVIIDAVCDIVPAVKPQIAMYEKYGIEGLNAYLQTAEYAKEKGLIVIGDIKRGDISSTAEAYAAHIGGTLIDGEEYDLWKEDFITINPYLGEDGIKPFTDACTKKQKGIFVLVKTSNPSSSQLQDLYIREASETEKDNIASNGKSLASSETQQTHAETVYERVGLLVKEWGKQSMGMRGYSSVGAVVGATHSEEGAKLRSLMEGVFFLVPGYGAQGGTAEELKGFFDKDGRGCIINSSRGIIAAYQKDGKYGNDFGAAARGAAEIMKRDLAKVR